MALACATSAPSEVASAASASSSGTSPSAPMRLRTSRIFARLRPAIAHDTSPPTPYRAFRCSATRRPVKPVAPKTIRSRALGMGFLAHTVRCRPCILVHASSTDTSTCRGSARPRFQACGAACANSQSRRADRRSAATLVPDRLGRGPCRSPLKGGRMTACQRPQLTAPTQTGYRAAETDGREAVLGGRSGGRGTSAASRCMNCSGDITK